MPTLSLTAADRSAIAQLELADTMWSRAVGLLGRQALAADTGLLIKPCLQIHTWFMRFAIDAVFVDSNNEIVRVVDTLTPFRSAWGGLRARAVLELPAGTARRHGLEPGMQLRIEAP